MIPIVVVFGAIFWVLMAAIKYWYFSRMRIKYTYKLDKEVLDQIYKPLSKEDRERIQKRMKARQNTVRFKEEPEVIEINDEYDDNDKPNTTADSPQKKKTERAQQRKRPLTLFEEMDLRKSMKKGNSSRFNRTMFDDPLSKLYRELQKERNNETPKKKND